MFFTETLPVTFCLNKQFGLKSRYVANDTWNEVDEVGWPNSYYVIHCCWLQMDFPSSFFIRQAFLKDFYSKFDYILNDSLSLVNLLEIS